MSAKRAAAPKVPRINKSQLIRDELQATGIGTPSKQIISRLKERNVDVSPAQVSNVKAMLKRKPAAVHVGKAPDISVEDLMEAKKLADRLGGVAAAIRALELLQRLR